MKKLFLLLLLLGIASAQAPVPNPQVPFSGKIGPGGNFPLLNGGTIVMSSDADRTMVFPEFTGSVLRVITAMGVSLSQTRNLIAPTAQFGYEFTIENATAGGQAIQVIGSTGTGVTIPNGQAMMVIFDGTNYVATSPGAGGGGGGGGGILTTYNVPLTHAPIQSAVNAAAGTNTGPVVIARNYSGMDTYTNIGPGPDVADYRTRFNNQSPASQPLSLDQKFGLIPDGKFLFKCSVVSGSPNLTCTDGAFTAQDAGKLAVCYGCGAANGILAVAGSVVSGGTGGKPNTWQEVFFTDGGCTTQPRASVLLNGNGVPTGTAQILNGGAGCSSLPTQGQVETVSGPTTFTGGILGQDNLTTTITAVPNSTTVTLAENAGSTATVFLGYGSDNKAQFQAYADSFGGNNSGLALRTSWGIINGIYFISGCISFTSFNGRLSGTGSGSIAGGSGAIIVYAGSTFHDCMFNVRGGLDSRIERIHFFGNSQYQPDALRFSFNLADGLGFINAYHYIDQNVFGTDYTATGPDWFSGKRNLWHGIYSQTNIGNQDFFYLPTNRVNGAEIGYETNNYQSIHWWFGTWWGTYNHIGFDCSSDEIVQTMFFGGNDLDIMVGSVNGPAPENAVGVACKLHVAEFGSESSQQMLATSKTYPPAVWQVKIDKGNFQPTNWLMPAAGGVRPIIDYVQAPGWPALELGNFFFQGAPPYYGGPEPFVIQVGAPGGCYNYVPTKFEHMTGIDIFKQIVFTLNPYCAGNMMGQPFEMASVNEGMGQQWNVKVYPTGTHLSNPFKHEEIGTVVNTGLLNVAPVGVPHLYTGAGVMGATGSTDYKYVITTVVGDYPEQYESSPTGVFDVPNGNATLNGANKNFIGWEMIKGASFYHVYRSTDGGTSWECLQGAGDPACHDFTFMDNVNGTPYPYAGLSVVDDGSWYYLTSYPNITDQTGTVNAAHFAVNGNPFGMRQLADWDGSTVTSNQFVVSNANGQFGSGVPASWTTGTSGTNGIPSIAAGGVSGQFGFTGPVASPQVQLQYGNVVAYPFQIPAGGNATVGDIMVQFAPAMAGAGDGTGNGFAAIYASDGPPIAPLGSSFKGAGTLLCLSQSTAIAPGLVQFILPGNCKVSAGLYYFLALHTFGGPWLSYNAAVPSRPVCVAASYNAVTPPRLDRVQGAGCSPNTYSPIIYADYITVPSPGPLYNLAGTGTSCVQVDSAGNLGRTGSTCGSGGTTSGNFVAGGDLSGSETQQTVVGIRNNAVPAPSSGYLRFNAGTFTWDTPASGNVSSAGSPAAYQLPIWRSATALGGISPGTTGQVLTSNGSGADPSWQTAGSAAVYNAVTSGTLTASAGFIIGPITMVTPTVKTNYRLEVQFKQTNTTSASGCTAYGTVQIRPSWTDGDTGMVAFPTTGSLTGYNVNGGASVLAFQMTATATTTTNWIFPSYSFNAAANQSVSIAVYQNVASAGCTTTFPTVLLRAMLYDLGP